MVHFSGNQRSSFHTAIPSLDLLCISDVTPGLASKRFPACFHTTRRNTTLEIAGEVHGKGYSNKSLTIITSLDLSGIDLLTNIKIYFILPLLKTEISPVRQIPFNPARNTDRDVNLSLSNTRDNFVRYALTRKTCPICSKPLVIKQRVTCSCGFTIRQVESERHKASIVT